MAKQANDTESEYRSVEQQILSGDYKPVYLFFGTEHYFIDRLCNLLLENVIPEDQRDFGQLVMYGADVTAAQVVSSARQFPMMSERQLVVVKEAQMMDKVEDIGIYFDAVMPSTVLVICYKTPNDPSKRSSKNVDKRSSFYKKALKCGVVFESNQLNEYKVTHWIEQYVRGKLLQIEPEAASLLFEYAGADINKIVLEVDKLVKLLPCGTKCICVKDVEDNVGISRDCSVFELTKALSLKDSVKAFRIVRFFSQASKRYPFVAILPALSSHFIKLLKFHALLQDNVPYREILSELGINPYYAKEYETAIRNYPVNRVIRAVSLLKEADVKSKSSLRGEADDGELLQELVSKILFL